MIDHERPHQPVLDQSERAPFPLLGSVLSDSVTSRAPHTSHGRVAFSGGVVFLSLLLFRILRFGTIRRPLVPLLRPTLPCALLAAQPGSQVLNLQFSIFDLLHFFLRCPPISYATPACSSLLFRSASPRSCWRVPLWIGKASPQGWTFDTSAQRSRVRLETRASSSSAWI